MFLPFVFSVLSSVSAGILDTREYVQFQGGLFGVLSELRMEACIFSSRSFQMCRGLSLHQNVAFAMYD